MCNFPVAAISAAVSTLAAGDLAFSQQIWGLSRILSAAIYLAVAAIILFSCYTFFRRKRRR